jgi:methoxymalonate biosynthesis acyl carrier protein
MNSSEAKGKIKSYLSQYFKTNSFSDDDDIFALGLVNSLFAMQLVMFVENTFNIKVENDELDLENFKSVSAISEFVNKKLAIA